MAIIQLLNSFRQYNLTKSDGMAAWKEEIRNRLETHSRQIEDFLNQYQIAAVVTGGILYSRVCEFNVQGSNWLGKDHLKVLEGELAAVLDVPAVEIICQEGKMTVRVITHYVGHEMVPRMQSNGYPLKLLELMKYIGDVRPLTTILGASADGRPLLLHLPSADVSNILVAGSDGAGKTNLLRTLLFSLAARNKQHQLQATVIDYDPASHSSEPGDSPLAAFSQLPHLVQPVATTLQQAIQVLDFLVEEADYRFENRVVLPKIMLVVDNLDSLLEAGQRTLLNRLIHLLQYGEQVGIHLVLALENPVGSFTNLLLKCSFSVRFIGRVPDGKMARAAAGIPETGAEHLRGQGDFIAINAGHTFRFQTAYISDYDLYLAVEMLSRRKRKRIVVRKAPHLRSLFQSAISI